MHSKEPKMLSDAFSKQEMLKKHFWLGLCPRAHWGLAAYSSLFWLIEHGLTSAPTQYRLYGRRFLQVKRPNQQCQSTDGGWLVTQTGLSLTRLTSPCYRPSKWINGPYFYGKGQLLREWEVLLVREGKEGRGGRQGDKVLSQFSFFTN